MSYTDNTDRKIFGINENTTLRNPHVQMVNMRNTDNNETKIIFLIGITEENYEGFLLDALFEEAGIPMTDLDRRNNLQHINLDDPIQTVFRDGQIMTLQDAQRLTALEAAEAFNPSERPITMFPSRIKKKKTDNELNIFDDNYEHTR